MKQVALGLLVSCLGASVALGGDAPLRAGFRLPTADKPAAAAPPAEAKKPEEKKPDEKKAKPVAKVLPRAERLKMVQENWKMNCQFYVEALGRAEGGSRAWENLVVDVPKPLAMTTSLAKLIVEDPKDDVAFDAILALFNYKRDPDVEKMLAAVPGKKKDDPKTKLDLLALVSEHHLHREKTQQIVFRMNQEKPEELAFVRKAFAESKSAAVRSTAGQSLAQRIEEKAENPKLNADARKVLLDEALVIINKLLGDGEVTKLKYGRKGNLTIQDSLDERKRALTTLAVGMPLPSITGTTLGEKPATLAEYRGKVVLIDVWATWCGPCRRMIPDLRELTTKMSGKPFQLVSISVDEEKETLEEFLAKEKMPWTHWWDSDNGPTAKSLGVWFFPTTYLVDAKGVIRYKNIHSPELLKKYAAELVKEAELADAVKDSSGGR
ncbi:MAG: TlpA family protein disulfide reductase [Gemmataceae bacterium]